MGPEALVVPLMRWRCLTRGLHPSEAARAV